MISYELGMNSLMVINAAFWKNIFAIIENITLKDYTTSKFWYSFEKEYLKRDHLSACILPKN